MKVSLSWLNDHLDLRGNSVDEMADLLTFAGIEVEGIETMPEKLVVAEVKSSDKHPDADKLSVCQVDDGTDKSRQIVCGAKNYQVGDKVPLALPGCKLNADGKTFEIKKGKLRGVESHGMMCAAEEIGLVDDQDGLMILPSDLKPGTPLTDVFPPVYDLEITPNRPDLLSHLGMARELAALTGGKLKGPVAHNQPSGKTRPAKDGEVRIDDLDACPLYTARLIRGVKVGPSPSWLQEKLTSIGLRPINNIVDITNYVLMEMGQPLHAFDLAKLNGGIVVRPAQKGEKFHALDGETYKLSPNDLVIADQKDAHALGGVMGGEDSGVTESTTDILLESAYFKPSAIRRTSARLNLKSDSSYRFERGVDPAQVIGASELAAKLILEIAGGKADDEILIAGEVPETDRTVPLDNEYCRRLIGHEVTDKEIDGILSSLSLKKAKKGWEIPTYRLDLERPVDLIEEVARVYGLDKVPSRQTGVYVEPSKSDGNYDFQDRLKKHLSATGFCECQTIKLISEKQLDDAIFNLSPVRVKNPLTDDHVFLRPSLVPALLKVAEHNVRMGTTSLRLFEIGTTFAATPKGQSIEQTQLALLLTGAREDASWQNPQPGELDIHAMRGVLESLCGGREITFSPAKDERLLLAAEISAGKTKLGTAGQLWPARTRELDLEQPVIVAEIDLKKLASALAEPPLFTELPKFPTVTRDVAIEAPLDLTHQQIAGVLAKCQEPLLEEFELFDVFTDPDGKKLPADRKSLAYSLTYRDRFGTLESATVDAAHGKILDALKKDLPVQFR